MVKRPQKLPPVQPPPGQMLRSTVTMQQERLIGRLCIAWSKLEAALDHLIWTLLGLEFEQGRVMTKRLQADGKIQILKSLGPQLYSDDEFRIINDTLDKINIARDDRNFIIHGSWATVFPSQTPIAMSLRPNSPTPDKVIGEPFPAIRMHQQVDVLGTLKSEIVAYIREAGGLPEELPPLDLPL